MAENTLIGRPLTKLYSLKSLRIVDSPRSTDEAQQAQLALTKKQTAPVATQTPDSLQEEYKMQTALEFSIDDLFSRIEKITSEFTPSSGRSGSIASIYNQIESIVPDKPATEKREITSSPQLFVSNEPPRSNKKNSGIKDQHKPRKLFRQTSVQEPPITRRLAVDSQPQLTPFCLPQKLSISDFQLGKTLGSGKFGDVLQCRHKKTGTLYALKKIFKSTIKEYNMVDQFTEELKIHYSLNHPNIVKLYTHFEDAYHIFLLMEYIDGGQLMQYVKAEEKFVGQSLIQVLRGVEYLHRNNIAHRDIKPENIVISNKVLKLCDFGWAANCQTGMKKTFCGTLDYVSPEILQQRQYHLDVDLWSLGVLTFEMLAGFPPFKQDIPKLKVNRIKNVDKNKVLYPPQIQNDARDFIGRFLKKVPEERMSIRQAFNHPFLLKYMNREKEDVLQEIKVLFD